MYLRQLRGWLVRLFDLFITPQLREQILAAREAVWRAYFTNDQARLEKLVPADTIVLENSPEMPRRTAHRADPWHFG